MSANPATHVLAYVRRKVVGRPGLPVGERDEPAQPIGHAFSQHWLWRRHAAGDALTIWLFGCLRFGRSVLPPALDARMQVAAELPADPGALQRSRD